MILKDQKTSSTSEQKTKPALLNKYEENHQKEVDGYERLKTKDAYATSRVCCKTNRQSKRSI